MKINAALLIILSVFFTLPAASQISPPNGWGDFQVGLVNDNSNIINVRMKKALSENVKLHYRYAYVNNGVDPNSNALSWLFNQWGTDYSRNSSEMGLRPAYVIYMLQEEGGAAALKNNVLNQSFMRNYFNSIRIVAEKSNGYKAIFIIEPDTWGYFLQNALEQGLQSDPRQIPANINNLGAGYEHLNGLPNTLSGVAQGVIKTIRRYAPDAYCGLLMSFWSVGANGATGPPVSDGAKGMVYWNQSDVDFSALRNAEFANQLYTGATDRGDFIGVEKNGWSAGNWLVKQNRNDYYWNDTQNAKWVSWCKTLRQNVNLPLLGWQISIGHLGMPNTVNRYEDTFMPYFFSHVPQYIDAGFIGFLVGKGLADCTDFTNINGNTLEANGSAGDDGWFFEKLKTFDAGRPYLGGNVGPSVSITAPSNNATFPTGSNITINALATGGTGCNVSKVEFFNGTNKLGEDTSSPYALTWNSVPTGNFALTAKVYTTCSTSATATAINIIVGNTLPVVSISAPANNATFTAPATIVINVNASDSDGSISKVEFFQGANKLGEDPSFPYAFTWSSVNAGSYALSAKTTDNGGATAMSGVISVTVNTGGGSCNGIAQFAAGTSYGNGALVTNVSKKYSCKVPGWCSIGGAYEPGVGWAWTDAWLLEGDCNNANVLPSISITSPSNNAVFTVPASINIAATATDTDGTISKVEFYNGATKLAEDLTTPYSYTWTNVSVGNYTLTAKAFDNSGGITTSAVVNITTGNTNSPPTATIISPANAATFTAPANIVISANASDSDGAITKVEFYQGATKLGEDTSSPYNFTWSNVAAGNYGITTKATDNAGATATSPVVNISVTSGNAIPTTTIAAPSNGATFTAPASIAISATASDVNGSISKVEFYQGQTKIGEDATAPYSFTWTNVAAGAYSLITKAIDNQGAIGTSVAVSITVANSGGCSGIAQYQENGGYSAGSIVQRNGIQYECKPYPYSGWCNGAAWAYAPGTGAYWSDAWIQKANCNGARISTTDEGVDSDDITVYPNPGSPTTRTVTILLRQKSEIIAIDLQPLNGTLTKMIYEQVSPVKVEVTTPSLPHGLYILHIRSTTGTRLKKVIIQ